MTSLNRQRVLELHNRMLLSPETFSFRWGMDAAAIAAICGVSRSSASHWLVGRTSRRIPGIAYQRILAVADFLLTNADRMQPLLEQWQRSEESED
ncbi:hypothetical protein [Phormidesmis priestleyi]|uniref:hypothetical protein n=1 Tax=Phormidesmis priestleyi TaxID=268141 RepID=UPI00083A1DC4|nr:hypothetical protein [Phormidesmis priestleyi]